MEVQKLIKLKTTIEQMENIHHIKILQILINNGIKFSENRNGIFINMNEFNAKTINDIDNTLLYICKQEKALNDIENEKSYYQNNYFENNNKEKNIVISKDD